MNFNNLVSCHAPFSCTVESAFYAHEDRTYDLTFKRTRDGLSTKDTIGLPEYQLHILLNNCNEILRAIANAKDLTDEAVDTYTAHHKTERSLPKAYNIDFTTTPIFCRMGKIPSSRRHNYEHIVDTIYLMYFTFDKSDVCEDKTIFITSDYRRLVVNCRAIAKVAKCALDAEREIIPND